MYVKLVVACALCVYYLLLICIYRNCLCNCVRTCYVTVYVTVYVPDYVTGICVLGSGTNEGSSPCSGRGRPPSLVPTDSTPMDQNFWWWEISMRTWRNLREQGESRRLWRL